tara:strand:- start:79 stop:282 length:204 start_codon:yes stop_codon:yes gene_type:complete
MLRQQISNIKLKRAKNSFSGGLLGLPEIGRKSAGTFCNSAQGEIFIGPQNVHIRTDIVFTGHNLESS